MNSPEREYWIAGGREELKSLEDLKVFILIRGDGEVVGWEDEEVNLGDESVKGRVGW